MSNPPLPPLDYASAPPPGPVRIRFGRGLVGWLIFVAVAALLFVWLKQGNPGQPTIALSDFYKQLNNNNVSMISIDGDAVEGVLRRPVSLGGVNVVRFRADLPAGTAGNWTFTQFLLETSPATTIRAATTNNVLTNFVLPFIPWLLIVAFIWFFVFRQLRKNTAARTPMPVIIVNPEAR